MKRRFQRGFSLIELLIVVAIVMVISAIAVPNLLRARQHAYEASAVGFLRTLQAAQIAYRTSNGAYATSFDVLPEVWVNTTTVSTSNSGNSQGNQGQGNQGQGNQGQGNQGQGQGNQGQGNQGQGQGNQGQGNQGQGNRGQGSSGGNSSSGSTATVLVRSNYIFTLTTTNAEQWSCAAAPTLDRYSGRYFYTDETGAIRVATGTTASAASDAVQ